ncbi:MAG: vanadium-dependent haloperoxidase [Caldilineaceae bacterium]|nr:vanadium-dependent haloperoxidase [Caldilineaceae bacterium]
MPGDRSNHNPSNGVRRNAGRLGVTCLAWALIAALLLIPAPIRAQDGESTLPNAGSYDHSVATAWFDLMTELVRQAPGFTPPVASRAMGYAGVTLYEAIVPGMPGYQSLAGQLDGLAWLPPVQEGATYHWPLVANSALAGINRRLFAHGGASVRGAIDGLEETIRTRYETTVPTDVIRRSTLRGRAIAAAIFAWSKSDGGHEGYMFNFPRTYQPPQGEGLWVATPPKYQRALQPWWGENRPFALPAPDACLPPPPPAFSTDPSSDEYAEAWEVYTTVQNLTPYQRDTALYWADDATLTATPPGHSLAIATQVLREESATLDQAAEVYARVGMALADAFIACWDAKFHYNRIRPITYIQRYIDPAWNATAITDPVYTPPFPEYPSGHSTEAGAAATILSAIFGDDYAFTDRSQERLGFAPRTYASFWEAAREAAESRLYGGIHYRSANEQGLEQGVCVAGYVEQLQFKSSP